MNAVIPPDWKKACTILVYKRGNHHIPPNFCPITLESIPLEIFTSCLRNIIFKFLVDNNHVEHEIQKGLTSKLCGSREHTAQMTDIDNKAHLKQRSLIVILLDLTNALVEVHHNLISEVLTYHHVPAHIRNLIKSLYRDCQTSIVTSEFMAPFISVELGVLQGDS